MKIDLYDLLIASAEKGLNHQYSDGRFEKGHNGPWNDTDTYVRTTAHWSLLMYKVYKLTNKEVFLDSAIKACEFLLSDEARPMNKSFYCRKPNTGKNRVNGLIGQAWAVEPLIYIGSELDRHDYLEVATEIFNINSYNKEKKMWSLYDVDGSFIGYEYTLNQQIWFSTMALLMGEGTSPYNNGIDFFKSLIKKIEYIDEKGLINHVGREQNPVKRLKKKVRFNIPLGKYRYQKYQVTKRSKGYLSFILYGIALAYKKIEASGIWENDGRIKNVLLNSINYMENGFPNSKIEEEFSWQYNPTGIEMAYTYFILSEYLDLEDRKEKWLTQQISRHFDFKSNLLSFNTVDPNILASRLYEAARLPNIRINIEK